MKALIRREIREHFKLAVIGLVILSAMLALGFFESRSELRRAAAGQHYGNPDGFHPLVSKSLLTQVSIFCGLFGGLLGWLQIRAEKHPDLWAFLVHRPVPRTTILKSKIASGLVLYAMGSCPPTIALFAIAMQPGAVAAPTELAMTLPLLSVVIAGTAAYLAGVLTALRHARWYVSRGVGIGVAVLVVSAATSVPEFWQALGLVAVANVILLLCVWGHFQTGGFYNGQPVVSKGALILTTTLSSVAIVGVVLAMVVQTIWPDTDHISTQHQVSKKGQILRVTTNYRTSEAEAVDLGGAPVLDPLTGQKLKGAELNKLNAPGLGASYQNPSDPNERGWRESFSSALRYFRPWRVLDKALWYLTQDGKLVAYHGPTRQWKEQLIPQEQPTSNSISSGRFLRPTPFASYFFRPYERPEFLASHQAVYAVDLEKRSLKSVLTTSSDDPIVALSEDSGYLGIPGRPSVVALTRGWVTVLEITGAQRLRTPFQPGPPDYASVLVHFLEATNQYVVRLQPDYERNQKSEAKFLALVQWINPDGSTREKMTLPDLPQVHRSSMVEDCVLVLMPIVLPIEAWDLEHRLPQTLRVILALICAGVGLRLGRLNHFSKRRIIAWTLFHLATGLPGLMAFLSVQEWPAKEACGQCTESRGVDMEDCEHCGAAFPPPQKLGIEIFEPLTAD